MSKEQRVELNSGQTMGSRIAPRWVPATLMLLASAGPLGCKGETSEAITTTSPSATAASPPPELPAPFGGVRLGMTLEELEKQYPPLGDLSNCKPALIGGPLERTPTVPGVEDKPHARCATASDVAGLSRSEAYELASAVARVEHTDAAALSVTDAITLSVAQIRGSLRAGTIDEKAVFDASATGKTAYEAVLPAAERLYDGSAHFARQRSTRRVIAALVTDDCSDLDPVRTQTYVSGGFSLGELDTAARQRVAYSKCRGPYVQNERQFQHNFLRRVGALGAIGLARAAQKDRTLNPDDPSTFTIFSSRSRLDTKTARLGVLVASSFAETQKFWDDAVMISAGSRDGTWGAAIVWITGDKVSRVLVNIADAHKLGELADELTTVVGKPADSAGTVTRWSLPDAMLVLDIGGSATLSLTRDTSAASKKASRD